MWNQTKYSNFSKDLQTAENFKYHLGQLKKIKESQKLMINNSTPVKPKFLDFPLKLREYNVIKEFDLTVENKKLFQKIERINKKQNVDKICDVMRKQEYNLKSISNLSKRYRQIRTISEENDKLYQRIKQTQPVISNKELDKQDVMNSGYKDMLKASRRINNPMMERSHIDSFCNRRSQSNRVADSKIPINHHSGTSSNTNVHVGSLLVKKSEDRFNHQRDLEFKLKLEQEYQKYQQKLVEIKSQEPNKVQDNSNTNNKIQDNKVQDVANKNSNVNKNSNTNSNSNIRKVQKTSDDQAIKEEDQVQENGSRVDTNNKKCENRRASKDDDSQQKVSRLASEQNIEKVIVTDNSVHRKNEIKIEEYSKKEDKLEKQQFINI